MKRLFTVTLALLFAFNITTYAQEDNIVDIVSTNEDFTILKAALTQADLIGALQGDGPFTVFAPTDQAFKDLLTSLDISESDLLNHPMLADVLLYHVVSGKIMSGDLSDNMTATTLKGDDIAIGVNNKVTINDSTVITADIEASNGVIHVIDKVLVSSDFKLDVTDPMMDENKMDEDKMTDKEIDSDIVDIALSDPQFSMLVMLLQKADLVSALQSEGPFTVIAPTNDAFVDLVTSLGITPEELMAQPDLAKVLLYHVVSGNVMSTDLSNSLVADTLDGETITFDLSNGVMVNSSQVIAADIKASNGVVHVIDKVLVPSNFSYKEVDLQEASIPNTGTSSPASPFLPIIGIVLVLGLVAKRKFFV